MTGDSTLTYRFGMIAALAAASAAIAYDIPQILQVAGILTDPWDRILIFAPSLLLAPCFVLTMAAVYLATPAHLRVWSLAASAMAILYAADVSAIYIVQLGAVLPRDLSAQGQQIAFAACCGPAMPATAIDLLGYTWMGASTLLLAPAFPGNGLARWLRLTLIANGLLAPLIIGQLVWPTLIYAASPWIAIFPLAMILLALVLRGKARGEIA